MRTHFFLAFATVVALAGHAIAAADSPLLTAPKAKTASNLDPNKMICKTVVPTGSRLGGTKVCQTRAQWDILSKDSQDSLNDRTTRALQIGPAGH